MIIFVGGLATNTTIENKIKTSIEELNESIDLENKIIFKCVEKPQVAIIKGIRAELCDCVRDNDFLEIRSACECRLAYAHYTVRDNKPIFRFA